MRPIFLRMKLAPMNALDDDLGGRPRAHHLFTVGHLEVAHDPNDVNASPALAGGGGDAQNGFTWRGLGGGGGGRGVVGGAVGLSSFFCVR